MSDETRSRSFDFTQALEGSTPRRAFDFTTALDETSGETPKRNLLDFNVGNLGGRGSSWSGERIEDGARLGGEERQEEPAPRETWDQLPAEQRDNDLGDWYRQWQKGSEPEDWQKQALKEFNIWAGDKPPIAADHAEEDDSNSLPLTEEDKKLFSAEGIKVAVKSYLSSWFDKNRLQIIANLGGGAAAGFLANMCFAEIIAQNRQMASFLPHLLTELQSVSILTTNASEFVVGAILTGRGKRELLEKHLKAASLAEQLAIARSADNLIDRVLIDGLAATKSIRGIALHPGTMGFVSGAWLYAALSGAGVFGESGLTQQAHAAVPADSGGAGGAGAGGEQAGGNLDQPDMESLRAKGKIEIPDSSAGQPPADQPSPAGDWAGVDEQLNKQAMDKLLEAQRVAEAAKIAALNQGQTVLEIATTMPQQTVSEAILKIIGDIPHGGEITNVIYRAAGEDVGKLHEGAIRELANTLSDLFSKADTAANNFGVPYDKGVLNAVNNTQSLGPNSSVANIIRAGNLGDMEAAAKIREEVFRPILGALAK